MIACGYGARMLDREFLGLTDLGDGRFRFVVEDHLTRLDGRLYGGTAIAVSVATGAEVSGRDPLWMTTQFVSTVEEGGTVDVLAEVLAPGKRTNQVRVTGTNADGGVIFASLGATGHHRPDGLHGEFETMPTVSAPEDSEVWASPFSGMLAGAGIDVGTTEVELPPFRDVGFTTVVEMRNATIAHHPDPGPGRLCVWLRRKDGGPISPAIAAYMADMVPMSVAHGCGVLAGGTSLDNSIRVGTYRETDTILLDLRPHMAAGDYGHGLAHIWHPDGTLMASASQTAAMIRFDLDAMPWMNRPAPGAGQA